MKKRLLALALVFVLVFPCLFAHADPTGFADVLLSVDYGEETTYVIGHKCPDSDTIGSAIACAYLLQQLGINAKAVATAQVNQETQFALDYFGMKAPEIMENAEGK